MTRLPSWSNGVAPPVVDLHLHTVASDGLLTSSELISRVAQTGLRVVAITDHDSIEGVDEALAAARDYPSLTVIPGIELSTGTERSEVHMLGFFIDYRDPGLAAALTRMREARVDSARRSVAKLNQLGIRISWERVQELAGGAIGRPHIARAMVEAGYIETPQEAFNEYLGDNGLAKVERERLPAREGIAMIHRVGGAAAIAHPRTVDHLEEDLEGLVAAGLDGIEVFAEKYGADERASYAALAERFQLAPCGGSDYHAFGTEGELMPGAADVPGPPPWVPGELERRAEAHRGGSPVSRAGR